MFPFFNNYPGTDLHEIDLAYILKLCAELRSTTNAFSTWKATHEQEYKKLKNTVDGLVSSLVEVIVPWDSSKAYQIYSVVEYQGTNYIALQDVPVGTMITNTDYWTPANTVIEQINAIGISVAEILEKVKEIIVTPLDFGAVGDGEADDTEAMQAAIDFCEDTGALLYLPKNNIFRISTCYITKNMQIFGQGKIKLYGIRRTGLGAAVTAGDTSFSCSNTADVKVGQILVFVGTHTEVMVVTGINEDIVTVNKFRYYDGNSTATGFEYAHAITESVHIESVGFVVSAQPLTADGGADVDGSEYPLNNLLLSDFTIEGTRSGYDASDFTVYDITLNGGIFCYRVAGVRIENCKFTTLYNIAAAFLGRCEDIKVTGCSFSNIMVPSGAESSYIDNGSGVLFHWDQRTSAAADHAEKCEVSSCVFENVDASVFASAAQMVTISNNKITGARYGGITIYGGDTAFGAYNVVVTGNTISNNQYNSVAFGIKLLIAFRCVIANNSISLCNHGIYADQSADNEINGNVFVANMVSIFISRLNNTQISSNRFLCGNTSTQCIVINNTTALSIENLGFTGNMYSGYTTGSNQAWIQLIAAQNVTVMNELCAAGRMFTIGDGVSASDNITAIGVVLLGASMVIAPTAAERAKVKQVDNYTAYQTAIRRSTGITVVTE